MEIIKTEEDMTNAVGSSTIKVCSGLEYMKQMNSSHDIPVTDVGLESIKLEKDVKEENITFHHSEMNIKTEIGRGKDETDTKAEFSYEQLNSIKTEDNSTENYQMQFSPCREKLESRLQNHIEVTHKRNVNFFKCHFCEYITKDIGNLKTHLTREHRKNAELYQCFNCKYGTKVKDGLVNKKTEWLKCHLCNYKSRQEKNLLQHHRIKHDNGAEILHCELCNFETKNRTYLKNHKLKHDEAEIFHCDLCDIKMKNRSLLRHHKIKHEDTSERFRCEFCDYKTKHKICLQKHRLKHNAFAELFRCESCDYKTKQKNCLLRHHRLKHNDSVKLFHCDLCDLKTKYKHSLLHHRKLKHEYEVEVFNCKLCDFKTKRKDDLVKHSSKHDNSP